MFIVFKVKIRKNLRIQLFLSYFSFSSIFLAFLHHKMSLLLVENFTSIKASVTEYSHGMVGRSRSASFYSTVLVIKRGNNVTTYRWHFSDE